MTKSLTPLKHSKRSKITYMQGVEIDKSILLVFLVHNNSLIEIIIDNIN